jgi:hypothetical protein
MKIESQIENSRFQHLDCWLNQVVVGIYSGMHKVHFMVSLNLQEHGFIMQWGKY